MTTKPYPFTPEQEAWLTDLETTEEPQTIEFLQVTSSGTPLYSNPVGYCCLGRACVVLGIKQHENEELGRMEFGHDREDALLPAEALVRLRLFDHTGSLLKALSPQTDGERISCLTDMNDMKWSFKKIAAYIRSNPENVFLPLEEDKA